MTWLTSLRRSCSVTLVRRCMLFVGGVYVCVRVGNVNELSQRWTTQRVHTNAPVPPVLQLPLRPLVQHDGRRRRGRRSRRRPLARLVVAAAVAAAAAFGLGLQVRLDLVAPLLQQALEVPQQLAVLRSQPRCRHAGPRRLGGAAALACNKRRENQRISSTHPLPLCSYNTLTTRGRGSSGGRGGARFPFAPTTHSPPVAEAAAAAAAAALARAVTMARMAASSSWVMRASGLRSSRPPARDLRAWLV
jgi:hypothetical protein